MPTLSIRGLSLGVSLTVVVVSGVLSAGLSYDAANKAVASTRESGDRGVNFAFAVGSESASNLTVQLFVHILSHVEERVLGFLGVPLTSLSILLRHMSSIPPDLMQSAEWRRDHIEVQLVQTLISLSRSGVRAIHWYTPFGAPIPQWFYTGELPRSFNDALPVRRDGFYFHVLGRNDGNINMSCIQEQPYTDMLRRAGMWEKTRCGKGSLLTMVDTSGVLRGGPCQMDLLAAAKLGRMSTTTWRALANARAARSCPDLLEGSVLCTAGGLCNCSEAVRRVPCSTNRTLGSPAGVSEARTVQQLCPHTCAACPVPEGWDPDGFGTCPLPKSHPMTKTVLAVLTSDLEPNVPHYCGLHRGPHTPSIIIGGAFDHPDQPEHPMMGRRFGSLCTQLDSTHLSVFLRGIELPGDGRIAIIQAAEPFGPPLDTPGSAHWLLVAASHGRTGKNGDGMSAEVISVFESDDAIIAASASYMVASTDAAARRAKATHHVRIAEHCGAQSKPWQGPNGTMYLICSGWIHAKLPTLRWLLMVTLRYDAIMGRIERTIDETRDRIRREASHTSQALHRHWLAVAGIIAACTAALMLMTALLVVRMTKPLRDLTRHMTQLGRSRMKLAIASEPGAARTNSSVAVSDVLMHSISISSAPAEVIPPAVLDDIQQQKQQHAESAHQLSRLREIACLQQTFADLKVSLDHAQTMRDAALREQTRLQVEADVQSKVEGQLREELMLEQRRQEAAERKRTEAAALAREAALRAEAQSLTAKYLAHEVRNNLMPISRLFSSRTVDDHDWEVASTALDLVHESLQRSLDLGKLRCGLYEVTPTTFDAAAQVRLVVDVARARAGQHVNVSVAEGTPRELWVHTDPYLVHTLLINLASNAVKYTDRGAVVIQCAYNANELLVSVADTGRGIDEKKAESLFSEYRACKQQLGTGLGLPLCKSIVDTLNGSISFSGRDGAGTKFSASIPCPEAKLPLRSEASAAEGPLKLPARRRIMIVDDDVTCQKVIKHRLAQASADDGKDWSYEVSCSAESALSVLLTPRHGHQSDQGAKVDIVVIDEHMPLGGGEMLGTEAIRRLRAGGFTGAIIGCSGNTLAQDHRSAGADESWSKPPPPPQTVRSQLAAVLAQAARRGHDTS